MSDALPTRVTRFDADLVRRYYERHTAAFVAFGQGGSLGTLHRAVWGPGVVTRAEAFHYVENAIAARLLPFIESRGHPRVLDLGCGVGGSLCYLVGRLPITGVGITLSPAQAAIAGQRISAAGLADRVSVLTGDYTNVPDTVPPADLVFAIESFVHAPDATSVFDQCRRLVRPGGALIICDDFRRGVTSARATSAIERFCRGWHINTLLHPHELREVAAGARFTHESTTDLSPYLEIGRWRDRFVDVIAPAIERLPRRSAQWDPWLGGSALQTCLRNGWLGYDLVVFRRS